MIPIKLNEKPLPDSFPVEKGKFYTLRISNLCTLVVKFIPVRSSINGTILDLKKKHTVGEIRNCDVITRFFLEKMKD